MTQIVLPWPLAPIMLPITEWLPKYNWKEMGPNDLTAGLTVFVFLVPQGMAYSLLAGMPPIYGLYSSIVPLFIYAVLGTSQQLSIGPMAITSLLLGVTAQSYGFEEESSDYIAIVINLSLVMGLCMFVLGLLRLGSLANLISESVLVGFLTASALVIALNQIKYILGISVPRFTYTVETIYFILSHLKETNLNAASLGIATMSLLFGVRYWKKTYKTTPERMKNLGFRVLLVFSKMANFLCIIFGSLIAYGILEGGTYIDIVGHVPSGLKAPQFQSIGLSQTLNLIPAALALSFVAFAGNWAVARKYAAERDYPVDATQELIAEGLAVVVGSFFNCFAGSGGLARSAVNAESGAMTQLSSLVVAVMMLISVQVLTSLFYYIPMCVLAAVIEISIISMVDFDSMIKAYRVHRSDCLVMSCTFVLTFFVGVTEGLFAGIVLSIAVILYNSAFPYIAHLGKLPDSAGGAYKDIFRFKVAVQTPGVSIIRMDSTLFFANAGHFKDIALQAAQGQFHSSHAPIRKIIIDASCWTDIDLTGVKTLFDLKVAFDKLDITLCIAGAKWKVRDKLRKNGFMSGQAKHYNYFSVQDAMREVDRSETSSLLSQSDETLGDLEASPMHSDAESSSPSQQNIAAEGSDKISPARSHQAGAAALTPPRTVNMQLSRPAIYPSDTESPYPSLSPSLSVSPLTPIAPSYAQVVAGMAQDASQVDDDIELAVIAGNSRRSPQRGGFMALSGQDQEH